MDLMTNAPSCRPVRVRGDTSRMGADQERAGVRVAVPYARGKQPTFPVLRGYIPPGRRRLTTSAKFL
jgi:hypothetical protein